MTISASHVLPFNTNCLEFFPTDPNFLACGMYQFDEKTNQRLGGIKVFQFFDDNSFVDHSMVECCGIFEMKCLGNRSGLIAALSDGTCAFYDFAERKLTNFHTIDVDNNRMLLNLDIFAESIDYYSIAVTDNCGGLNLLKFGNDRGFEIVEKWTAFGDNSAVSSTEVWTCCFDPESSGCVVVAGAENGQLKIFDQRCSPPSVQYVKNRCHEAGVTHVGCSSQNPHEILTGGYDDKLKIWDKRNMNYCVDEMNLGGGVWRVKFEKLTKASCGPRRLLCSCMYNGWALMDIDQSGKLKLIEHENYNDQLLYAVDWYPNSDGHKFVSCTFYEKTLRLGSIKEI
uniref:methylated diphthine methylhydrolase n=1 Tax=Romanomermis culicivorax TaxID=13658 RepID=A0A915HJ39_ROMCU